VDAGAVVSIDASTTIDATVPVATTSPCKGSDIDIDAAYADASCKSPGDKRRIDGSQLSVKIEPATLVSGETGDVTVVLTNETDTPLEIDLAGCVYRELVGCSPGWAVMDGDRDPCMTKEAQQRQMETLAAMSSPSSHTGPPIRLIIAPKGHAHHREALSATGVKWSKGKGPHGECVSSTTSFNLSPGTYTTTVTPSILESQISGKGSITVVNAAQRPPTPKAKKGSWPCTFEPGDPKPTAQQENLLDQLEQSGRQNLIDQARDIRQKFCDVVRAKRGH
jgi:hypothetical protein